MKPLTTSLAALALFLAACGGGGGGGGGGAPADDGAITPPDASDDPAPMAPLYLDRVTARTMRDGVAAGPVTGGTRITIRGTGFGPGIQVTVGGRPALDVDVQSETKIQATTPASSASLAGLRSVQVRRGSEQSIDHSGFDYRANRVHWASNLPSGAGTKTYVHTLDPETGEETHDELTWFSVEAMAMDNEGRLFGVGLSRAAGSDYQKRFVFEIQRGSSVTTANAVRLQDQDVRVLDMAFYRSSLHVLLEDGDTRYLGTLSTSSGRLVSGRRHEWIGWDGDRGEGIAVAADDEQLISPYGRLDAPIPNTISLYEGHDKKTIVKDVVMQDLKRGEFMSALAFSNGALYGLVADYDGGHVRLVEIDRQTGAFLELANLGGRVDALAVDFR